MVPEATIAVVNFGSSELLAHNVVETQAAALRSGLSVSVIICDNRSTDSEARAVRALGARYGWTVLEPGENLGFGGGANLAAARAFAGGVQNVVVLNPDARMVGDSLAALVAHAADDRMTLASPVIRTPEGRVWFEGADLYLADGETRGAARRDRHADEERVAWISGACVLLTREVFEATGGFDPEYFLYWEDVDLSWRAARAGARLLVAKDSEAVHDAGGTQERTGSRGKSRTYYYFNTRNRLLFAARNLPEASVKRWLRVTPRVSWSILMRGGRRQLLADVGVLWAALRGSLRGRAIARSSLRAARVPGATERGDARA